jgi:hypothetical protein
MEIEDLEFKIVMDDGPDTEILVLIPKAGNDNCTCGGSVPGDPRYCSCSWLYQES